MQPAVAFWRVLRRLRKRRGLTQEAFGLDADLRRTFVSILELGQQQPTLTTILELANVPHIKPSKILDMVDLELRASPCENKREKE